jgi:hypothetical protein
MRHLRGVIALCFVVAVVPATAWGQASIQDAPSSDRPRLPVTVIFEPGSSAALPLRPPIGYPHIPGTVILPHPAFAQPNFAPLPPRPPRPISFRARVVTGAIAGFLIGGTFGLPSVSESCDVGARASGPCRAGSAALGLAMGGVAGAMSWLGRD